MTVLFEISVLMLIGLAGGIAVGSGMVAFLTVLDVIPRLTQITKSYHSIHWFERAVVVGATYWTAADFFEWTLTLSLFAIVAIGFLSGGFVGMVAAALTEVLNVLPILAKRLHMEHCLIWLLVAMVLGKVVGSLFHSLIYP